MLRPLRWLLGNLSALLLALVLAVAVWFSAVTAADPNVERIRTASIEIIGKDANMLIIGSVPSQVNITLRAPTSVIDKLISSENAVRAWVDLSALEAGTHEIEIHTYIDTTFGPVRQIQLVPNNATVVLEPLATQTFPVKLEEKGEPAIGYQKGLATHYPSSVTVSGPLSLVSQVDVVQATLDISDVIETIKTEIILQALDASGQAVIGVTIIPNQVSVAQPISLQGGYRNVVVRVVTTGQVANGYKLTNISVSPPNVVVFSTDPKLVNDLPSFVETIPLDINGVEDDIDTRLALDLPAGISVVDDQSILVQVSIAAIEGSIRISLPVTIIGLTPSLIAQISPGYVDVILTGPVPGLVNIISTDIRLVVDLKGMVIGTYQVVPVVDVLPQHLQVESILPSMVEVIISEAPTPTPTPTPAPTITPKP